MGMIESAMQDFEIDLERSWMVGDKKIDVETGETANIRSAFVLTGYGEQHKATLEYMPTVISDNLGTAAKEIIALDSAKIVF